MSIIDKLRAAASYNQYSPGLMEEAIQAIAHQRERNNKLVQFVALEWLEQRNQRAYDFMVAMDPGVKEFLDSSPAKTTPSGYELLEDVRALRG